MTNINHDQLFKELLTTFFVEFLELFFPSILEYLDTDTISFVDKELFTDVTKGKKKIMDIVALTKFHQQDYKTGQFRGLHDRLSYLHPNQSTSRQ